MTELRSPLSFWLEGESRWAEIPGVTGLFLEEADPDRVNVKVVCSDFPVTEQWLLDHGYVLPAPEPTPIERALGILAPHLRRVPIYQRES